MGSFFTNFSPTNSKPLCLDQEKTYWLYSKISELLFREQKNGDPNLLDQLHKDHFGRISILKQHF